MPTNTFKRKISRNVTTTTEIGGTTSANGYKIPSNTQAIVIGLRVTNVTTSNIKVSVSLYDGANETYLIGGPVNSTMGATVEPGASFIVVNGDIDKLVIETGDSIKVTSSGAADCILSLMEIS